MKLLIMLTILTSQLSFASNEKLKRFKEIVGPSSALSYRPLKFAVGRLAPYFPLDEHLITNCSREGGLVTKGESITVDAKIKGDRCAVKYSISGSGTVGSPTTDKPSQYRLKEEYFWDDKIAKNVADYKYFTRDLTTTFRLKNGIYEHVTQIKVRFIDQQQNEYSGNEVVTSTYCKLNNGALLGKSYIYNLFFKTPIDDAMVFYSEINDSKDCSIYDDTPRIDKAYFDGQSIKPGDWLSMSYNFNIFNAAE